LQNIKRRSPVFTLKKMDIEPLVQICQAVGGHPLALELASGWIKLMPLSEIAHEITRDLDFLSSSLRDMPARHRSIRTLFVHSWNLLTNKEVESLQRLSIFQGSFTRHAALQVAGVSLTLLANLVDKSILRVDAPGRYSLHELHRQFTLEKLKSHPAKLRKTQDQFVAYYAAFLASQTAALKGAAQEVALDAITEDIHNVRAAWRIAIQTHDETALEQSFDALHLYYFARSWYQEGADAFQLAAEALKSTIPNKQPPSKMLLGQLLAHQGRFIYRLGKDNQARELLAKSLEIFSRCINGNPDKVQLARAFSLYNLSEIERGAGNYGQAEELSEQSLDIYRRQDDQFGTARSLNHLGILAAWQGRFAEGQDILGQALKYYRALGYRYGIANTLNDLGIVADRLGEDEHARQLYQECLAIRRQIGHLAGIGASLNNLGFFAYFRGEYQEASQLLQESLEIQREIGDRYEIANCLSNLGNTFRELHDYARSYRYFREALQISAEINHLPLVLEVLGGIASNLSFGNDEDKQLAVEIFAFISGQPACDQPTLDSAQKGLELLQANLSQEGFAIASERGAQENFGAVISKVYARIEAVNSL
jgi:tetratricopeptide (TPR) repeat protein